jgi:hypothetical protein
MARPSQKQHGQCASPEWVIEVETHTGKFVSAEFLVEG